MGSSRFPTVAEAGAYLAAMIDGEGCLTHWRHSRRIEIVNTDPSIIEACQDACAVLGLTCSLRTMRQDHPHWKQAYRLTIGGRKNLERVREAACPQAICKQERLDALLGSYVYKRRAA